MQSDRHCTAVHAARRRRDQSVVAATSHIPFSRHYTTWALQTEPHKSHLGQRRPSGKSREAGRPGNVEDRQPMQAALADYNPRGDRYVRGRYRVSGKNTKMSSQNSSLTFLQRTIVYSILVTVPFSSSIYSVNSTILCDVPINSPPWLQGVCVCPYKYTSC